MQAAQTIGIDLPLRALVWRDGSGVTQVWLQRSALVGAAHGAEAGNEAILKAMAGFPRRGSPKTAAK